MNEIKYGSEKIEEEILINERKKKYEMNSWDYVKYMRYVEEL